MGSQTQHWDVRDRRHRRQVVLLGDRQADLRSLILCKVPDHSLRVDNAASVSSSVQRAIPIPGHKSAPGKDHVYEMTIDWLIGEVSGSPRDPRATQACTLPVTVTRRTRKVGSQVFPIFGPSSGTYIPYHAQLPSRALGKEKLTKMVAENSRRVG